MAYISNYRMIGTHFPKLYLSDQSSVSEGRSHILYSVKVSVLIHLRLNIKCRSFVRHVTPLVGIRGA